MSEIEFERGSSDRPRGHALLYFRDPAGDRIVATYLVMLPITIDVSRYIPPMLAAQMPGLPSTQGVTATATPLPPVPEIFPEGRDRLTSLADARDDDLLAGGSANLDRIDVLMQSTAAAAQRYTELYTSYMERVRSLAEPTSAPAPAIDADDLMYSLMGDPERLAQLVRITGRIRDGVERSDASQVRELLADANMVAKHLGDKYRVRDLLRAAESPGESGRRLTELLIERCYALLNEDYRRVQEIEVRVRELTD